LLDSLLQETEKACGAALVISAVVPGDRITRVVRMKLGYCFLFLTILVLEGSGKESNVENLVNQNNDHVQEDILSAMKDSGVLKEWKEKLEKLDDILKKENEIDDTNVDAPKKKSVFSKQEIDMLASFIDEYSSDQNLDVPTDLIISIVERVEKSSKPNLPQIFVQLGPIIDVISALSKKTNDLQKIIDRQGPVFGSPAKTKDVLHTLAENLKSELVRLTLETPPPSKKKSPPPPPPPKKEKKEKKPEDYLTNFFKTGNGEQLLALLSGSGDMSALNNILPQLLGGGNYAEILLNLVGSYLEGSPYGPLIKQYGKNFLVSEQGVMLTQGFTTVLENVAVSESGQRFVKVMPQLLAAKDLQSILEILGEEAEFNWRLFFDSIDNSEYKDSFIDSLADYSVQGYNFIQNPPKDSVLNQIPLMINGFLISYRIPAFDARAPVKSLTAILNKCIRLFTTYKTDTTPYIKEAEKALKQSLDKYLNGKTFGKLSSSDKKSLISSMIDSELVSPVQRVWDVYSQAASKPQCAEKFLCLLNMKEKKSKEGQTRLAVVKGASLAAGWTLSQARQEVYWSMYNAVMAGSKGADCEASYPSTRDSCKLVDKQTSQVNTAHEEL